MSAAKLIGTLCLLWPIFVRGEDLPAEVLLVAHTLQANRKLLSELQRYTCLETISRSQAATKRHKAEKQDVIRLDVGVGGHEEIYSWPGDPTFSSKDLFTLVGHGLLANGLFEAFAANVFVHDAAMVKAAGEASLDGKRTYQFSFTLPSLGSRWELNWLGARGSAQEKGEFWVQESDLTLLQLNVTAIDISPNVPLQGLTVKIHYRLLTSPGGKVLIPEAADIQAIERNGALHEEVAEFSHCRSFDVESSLSTSPSTEALPKQISRFESERQVLPPGMTFPVALETPVRADQSVVGDAMLAVLESPVKTPAQQVIPKGALLKGRIREFERLENPPNTFMVGLEFDELSWAGHAAAFFAGLSSLQPLTGVTTEMSTDREQMSGVSVQGTHRSVEYIRPVAIPGVASFFLKGSATLPRGFRMSWRTQDVARH